MCNSQTHQVVQKKYVNSPSDSSKVGEHNLAVLIRHVLTWEVAKGGYQDSITDISQCFLYQRYMCIYIYTSYIYMYIHTKYVHCITKYITVGGLHSDPHADKIP